MESLEDAVELDIHLISEYPGCKQIVDHLFREICQRTRIKNESRLKETLKLVILNLWVSSKTGLPTKYSRCPNSYTPPTRYGKLHIRYSRLIPVIDALVDMGLVEQKKGYFDRDRDVGRRTRIFPTKKLTALFHENDLDEPGIIRKVQPEDIIYLRDTKKNKKKMLEVPDTRSVQDMRTNLRRYNEFIKGQNITACVPGDELVDLHHLTKLEVAVLKGIVEMKRVVLTGEEFLPTVISGTQFQDDQLITQPESIPYYTDNLTLIMDYLSYSNSFPITISLPNDSNYNYLIQYPNPNTQYINTLSTITSMFHPKIEGIQSDSLPKEKRRLRDFGFDFLEFQSHFNFLHRVFNNGKFSQGGRFYGGFHLELLRNLRKHILINGEPVAEPDFSALHIRMLYHLEGIDYREDPYTVLCDSKEDRKVFKIVFLVAINAETQRKGIHGIQKELEENGIPFDTDYWNLKRCLKRVKNVHGPIAKYLNTGVGLKLQNLDGQITDLILKTLTREEIPVLPVHDSFIVRERDKDRLIEVMKSSYYRVMGYEPIIEWKGVMY
jgi:hypothetical protein